MIGFDSTNPRPERESVRSYRSITLAGHSQFIHGIAIGGKALFVGGGIWVRSDRIL